MDFIARILSATKGYLGAKTKEKPILKSPKGFQGPSKIKAGKRRRRSKVSTEQLVPSTYSRGQRPRKPESLSNLKKEVNNEDLNLRVLLLSPQEPVACEKSTINTSSRSGSVTVEVIRLSGAAEHHFRLDVTSTEDSAHVILPSKFRGNVYIDSGASPPIHINFSAEVRRSMDAGVVRVNSPTAATKDEDEIHVHAARNVKLQMAAEEIRRGDGEKEPVWILDSRLSRIGRMFKMP